VNEAMLLHERPEIHQRRWFLLGVMCLSLVMVVMAVSGLNVALPTMQRALGADATDLQWIVDAYAIVFAGLLLTAGALGDRFGRKGALLGGLTVFALGSVVGAFADSSSMVIAARAISGIGAAFVMPATLSLLTVVFPPHERGKAIAMWAGFAGAGGALGPLVAGFLLTGWWIFPTFWWGSVFVVNIVVTTAVIVAVTLFAPRSRDDTATPLDPVGAALSLVGVGALLYGIIEGPERGWGNAMVVGAFALAVVMLATFVWWELRTEHPMLPMRFFRNRTFALANVASLLMFFGMFGAIFFIAQFFQTVQGLSPFQSGLRILPWTAMPMLVAPIAGALSDRIGGHRLMGAGLALQAIGLAWIAAVSTPTTPYVEFIGPFLISGFGMALFFAPVAHVVLSSVRPEQEGQASGANNAIRELGGVVGVAVLAAVFTVNGGYGSGQQFVDGMNPAVMIGAALVAVGAIAAFAIKRSPPTEPVAVADRAPFVSACACASCWCAPPGETSDTEDPDVGAVPIPVLAGAS
jgi:EmrB/QacA subfamily drug resistance transporter